MLLLKSGNAIREHHGVKGTQPKDGEKRLAEALSFLWREYTPAAYWWELMEMLRRFVLVGVMVIIERGTIFQITVGTIFSAVYLLVQLQAQPFRLASDNYIALSSSFSLLMLFLCCACPVHQPRPPDPVPNSPAAARQVR